MTAALQRTRAYYSPVDDLTQFDLHIPNCRASASGFVYGLTDQRAPACLFVCFMYTYRGTVWLLLLWCENCNFWVHLINTELLIYNTPSFVRGWTLTYCTVQWFQMRKASLHCAVRSQRNATSCAHVFLITKFKFWVVEYGLKNCKSSTGAVMIMAWTIDCQRRYTHAHKHRKRIRKIPIYYESGLIFIALAIFSIGYDISKLLRSGKTVTSQMGQETREVRWSVQTVWVITYSSAFSLPNKFG